MNTIVITLCVSFGIAFVLGILLGFFKKVFHVPVDPTVEKIREVLPGGNCGACGYPGCDGFAAAVARGEAPVDGCAAGGAAVAKAVAQLMGVSANAVNKVVVLACQGSKEHAQPRGIYSGVQSCRAAKIAVNGTKMCQYGCIGLGDCVSVCKFDALSMGEDGLPHVDYEKCTGCGMCAKECPQGLFHRFPANQKGSFALCSNRSANKTVLLKQCKTACIKCAKCERLCPKQAIVLKDNLPLVDYEKCDSCGECVAGCPTKVLVLLENKISVKVQA